VRPAGLLACTLAIVACAGRTQAPGDGVPPRPAPAPVTRIIASVPSVAFTLDNGMRLLRIRDTRAPMFEARLVVQGGWREEADDQMGAARVLRELVLREPGPRSVLDSLGVSFVAATSGSDDEGTTTSFRLFGPSPSMTQALAIVSRAMSMPPLSDSAIGAMKQFLSAARRQARGNSETLATGEALRLAHPPAERDHMSPSDSALGRLTPDAVRALYAGTYRPERVTVAVVGPDSVPVVQTAIGAAFNAWRMPRNNTRRATHQPDLFHDRAPIEKIVRAGSNQVTLALAFPIATASPEEAASAELLRYLLSRGLNAELQEARGWTYFVAVPISRGDSTGAQLIRTSVTATHTAETLNAIMAYVESLPKQLLARDDLDQALRVVGGFMARSGESREALADRAVTGFRSSYASDYWSRFERALATMTSTDLRTYIARVLDPQRLSIVAVGDAATLGTVPDSIDSQGRTPR
jgi:zinc protease